MWYYSHIQFDVYGLVLELHHENIEAVIQRCSVKKVTLKKKETLAQMFFCEFCEIFKNTFFNRTTPVAVSENMKYGFD